jgi:Tol biopolymer transport system component/serine/threonine protein kinase
VAVGLSQGVRLGPYQIVAPLGAGGMGTVYKATDTRLGRTVAIKVLADRASCDPQQRLRFEQEARAVSTLNHPNICVLYDVGCETPSGGRPSAGDPSTPSTPVQFLVMEHLEGETLSKRLREGGVSFDQALDIGAQVADALAKAHRHGVIHRDLKPGNIMLTRSGTGMHAKLLDFGLAKLRQAPDPDFVSTHSKHEPDTRPGAVLGTLPYMPPEQLEGRATDARADIFALGCVLYEMLTGRRAFRGDSEASVISAIMAHEPAPLATLQPATPAALDHLIRSCLQKDPDQRAESAHDLADELRWLREAYRTSTNGDSHPKRRAMDPASSSGQTVEAPPTARPTRRHRRLALAFGLLAIGIVSYAVPAYLRGWWPWQPDPWSNAIALQITAQPGLQAEPAVSPDGHLFAYVHFPEGGGTAHVWLADATGRSRRQLTEGAEPDHDPAWGTDGIEVLFTRDRGSRREIWSVPWLSGSAKRLMDNGAQPAVSWDGTYLAFVREVAPNDETRVFVAPLQNLSQAAQVTGNNDGLWGHNHPSWSPNGRWLCYQAQYALWIVRAEGGGAKRLTTDHESATDPVWSKDGQWIYYTSSAGGTPALWKIPYQGGTPRRVRSGSGAERQPSFSRDGETLAFSTGDPNRDIAVHTISTGQRETFGTVRYESMPRFTRDGQAVVFVCGQTSSLNELCVQRLQEGRPTGETTQLTRPNQGEVAHPAVSPDGRWVAYYAVIGGQRDIWIVPSDGGPSSQITTSAANDIQPAWSPDGTRLAFVSDRANNRRDIWVVPVKNGSRDGSEVQITRGPWQSQAPEWSPESGKWIAYKAGPTTGDAEVWMTRADGTGTPRQVTNQAGAHRIRWLGEHQMVVAGTWGGYALSLRLVDPATGASTAFDPPVTLGDDAALCDFDVDLGRGLAVFTAQNGQGSILALKRRQ